MTEDLRKTVKNLKNRVSKIELQFKKFGVENLNFLIGNLRIQAEQIQSLQFTIGIQQKYIEGKGLKAEYEEWLQKEIDILNQTVPKPEGGQDHDGKIERVSRTEKGKDEINDKEPRSETKISSVPPEDEEDSDCDVATEPLLDKHDLD